MFIDRADIDGFKIFKRHEKRINIRIMLLTNTNIQNVKKKYAFKTGTTILYIKNLKYGSKTIETQPLVAGSTDKNRI
jgi:hypothetical protein